MEKVFISTQKNKDKLTDLTAGTTGHAILGWSNKRVIEKNNKTIKKISHIDYKYFKDENRTLLANKILSNKINKLDRVFSCWIIWCRSS